MEFRVRILRIKCLQRDLFWYCFWKIIFIETSQAFWTENINQNKKKNAWKMSISAITLTRFSSTFSSDEKIEVPPYRCLSSLSTGLKEFVF